MKITGWVVGLLRRSESLQASSEADKRKFFEVCHDFRSAADNVVAHVRGRNNPTHAHKNHPVIYDERKQIPSVILLRTYLIESDLKSFHKGFIREIRT